MRRIMQVGAIGLAMAGIAGIGHNMPPALASVDQAPQQRQAVLPRRIVDENRRNQKLKQKLRREARRQNLQRYSRAQRKSRKFGAGYRPGKLFKGHRV